MLCYDNSEWENATKNVKWDMCATQLYLLEMFQLPKIRPCSRSMQGENVVVNVEVNMVMENVGI